MPTSLDPLELDAASRLGVPGLVDALRKDGVVVANMPGSGVLEARALLGFLPALSRRLLGEELKMPNIATWWCGQRAARDEVLSTARRARDRRRLSARRSRLRQQRSGARERARCRRRAGA